MTSWLSKVLVSGLVMAATVGGVALPASAEPYPTHDMSGQGAAAVAVAGESDASVTTQGKVWTGGGTFDLPEGVGLGPGVKKQVYGMRSFDLVIKDNKPEMIATWDNEWCLEASAEAGYPIIQNGVDTRYWIQPTIALRGTFPSFASGDCAIFDERPNNPGAEPVSDAPYSCSAWKNWGANDFIFSVKTR